MHYGHGIGIRMYTKNTATVIKSTLYDNLSYVRSDQTYVHMTLIKGVV